MLAADIFNKVTYLVHYAKLDIGLGEHALNGVRKACKTVDTDDEYILNALILKLHP